MEKNTDSDEDTSKMAMAKMYEVNVTVKVVVHAVDPAEAVRLASRNLELQGWPVRSADTVKRVKV